MDIKIAAWQEQLIAGLAVKGIAAEAAFSGKSLLLHFAASGQLILHLIPIEHKILAVEALEMQSDYKSRGIQLVQLWEDLWLSRPAQVLSRIVSMLGKNRKIHGRKTKVITISQPEADIFLKKYHLQSSAKARHRYALIIEGDMLAVATFSAKRNMYRNAAGYTSVELIRFVTADGITIQGGLSKLIRHMIKSVLPNDVMTYADLDWSYGKGYTKLGFEQVEQSPPAELWLHTKEMVRYFPHRLPVVLQEVIATSTPAKADVHLASLDYYRIFNTGNLKYILYI